MATAFKSHQVSRKRRHSVHPLQRLLDYEHQYRKQIWLVIGCSILNKLFDLALPALIGVAMADENIAYGSFEATEQEIITAAKVAQAHYFIMHLPQGYETIVRERERTKIVCWAKIESCNPPRSVKKSPYFDFR